MRTALTCLLFSIQLYEGERKRLLLPFPPSPHTAPLTAVSPPACADWAFRQLTEGQSLQLSCPLGGEQRGGHAGLRLYHRAGQTQTTLLAVAEGVAPKVNPEHRGRLRLRGGLRSPQVNVSVSDLRRGDTGLYVCELSYRGRNTSEQVSVTEVLLLVEGRWFEVPT